MIRTTLFLLLGTLLIAAAERPNILWLTSEDNDKQWLGCYGNEQAKTPNIDSLAARSVRFDNFFSNAPVCAVARSTILTGIYAPSQGSQHMRSRHPIPAANKPYVTYLREAGYYCTNASKTDFNFEINDKKVWDECDSKAHYKNRAEGQPFFAVFNFTESHESSLFEKNITGRREKGLIPQQPRVSPADVFLRPYLPDLPEVREDIATYYDMITLMDGRIGKALAELAEQGLADDTIVFYYADHGGITPRGKRYLEDTGVNVPLLVHIPEKWKALSSFPQIGVSDETTAFVDLAPTLLSILGMPKPEQMQGRAFLGSHREEPTEDNYVFLFADRFDEIYGMRRGLTDGRWKYTRRFTPHYAAAPYSYYQFGQKAWVAWQKAWQEGSLDSRFSQIWEKNQIVEELFDTQADPWEVTNLASDSSHAAQLERMRNALKSQMVTIRDTGIIPEPMFAELAPKTPIARYAKKRANDWPALVDLAFTASDRNPDHLPTFIEKLSSEDPIERYWALQGCLILGEKSQPAADTIAKLLEDKNAVNRASAAQTLITLGHPEGAFDLLLKELSDGSNEYAQQNVVNIYTQLDKLDRIPDEWVKKISGPAPKGYSGAYVKRLANKLAEERGL
ncbi:MAG: sulfatase-like hydrolase/transferase [Roseibacillus sp.]